MLERRLGISPLQQLYPNDTNGYVIDGLDGIYQFLTNSIDYGNIDISSLVNRDSVLFVEDPFDGGSDYLEQNPDIPAKNGWCSGLYTNLFGYSLRARDWTMVNNATATANEVASPWGTDRADEAVFTASAADGISQTVNTSNTTSYNFSVWAKMQTGTGSFKFSCSADGGSTSSAETVTTTWTRFEWTVAVTTGETPSTFTLLNGDATARDILFWGMQLTVSKYPLPLVFGSNLNKISKPLEFEDVAWTKTDLTPDDDAGSNGVDVRLGVATSKLTATDDGGNVASSTFAVSAGDIIVSCLTLRKSSGSGDVILAFGDASDYAELSIDLDAGTVSTLSEVDIDIIESEIISLDDDWYRVNMRVNCSSAIAAAYTEIVLDTSGDVIDIDVCYGYIQEYNEHCMLTAPSDTTDLVSSYGFDNDEGFNDNTGANNGTNNGVALQGDGGFKFDGASYIDTNGDSDYTQERTYVWLAKSTKTTKNCVFSHGSLLKGSLFFNYAGGETWWIVQSNVYARWSPSGKEDDGDWHLYSLYHKGVAAGDITHVELRIDGQLQTPIATPEVSTAEPWGDLQLGTSMPGDAWYYEGEQREYLIYSGHLSADRILDIYTTAMLQQPILEYPETIAAEASAYTSADQEISLSSLPANGKYLCATLKASVAPTDMRASDGRIVGIDDGSDDYYIKFDQSGNQVTGHWDDADMSINAAALRTALAAGKKMFMLVCEDYLYIKDEDGQEWTNGSITAPSVKTLSSTSLGIGSELTTTTGDYADFADCQIYYAGSGGSNMSVMTLSYIRDLANWFLDKV